MSEPTPEILVIKNYDLAMPANAGKTEIVITIPDEILDAVSMDPIAREKLGRTPDGPTEAIRMVLELAEEWDKVQAETPADVAEEVNAEPASE